jgi:hypothetical protein
MVDDCERGDALGCRRPSPREPIRSALDTFRLR